MNRRSFISQATEAALLPERETTQTQSKFANKTLPQVERATSGLEQYTGPWGFDQVAHLLQRTMFGATRADINSMIPHTLDDVVSTLLQDQAAPNPPLNVSTNDQTVPIGQTWVNAPKLNPDGSSPNGARISS